jgi:hypothetical protein
VNGISRQQQEAVWENPRVVNDECLASIIGAHNLTDHDLMDLDGNPRTVVAAHRSSPPTLLLPPPVGAVVPMPLAIRPAADPNHLMAMGAHLGPKIIPTVIRPLTLVSVVEKSTRSRPTSSAAHPSSAFSASAKASPNSSSAMEDAIFDLDL